MWQNEQHHLVNSMTWSSYLTFLIFIGLALIASLPEPSPIEKATLNSGGVSNLLYPFVAILLFGILAMNFGQMQQESSGRFGKSPFQHYRRLLAQLAFLALLMLPMWVVYQGIHHLPPLRLIWGLVHLLVFGLVSGLFGLLVGLRAQSEIAQFNIKYAVFIAFTLLTGIWFQPLNPFLVPLAIFGDAVLDNQSLFFFVQSYLGFALLISMLLWFTYRQILSTEEVRA